MKTIEIFDIKKRIKKLDWIYIYLRRSSKSEKSSYNKLIITEISEKPKVENKSVVYYPFFETYHIIHF